MFFPLKQKACIQEIQREKTSLKNVLESTMTNEIPEFITGTKTFLTPNISDLPLSSHHLAESTQDVPEIQILENYLDKNFITINDEHEHEHTSPSEKEFNIEVMNQAIEKSEENIIRPLYDIETEIEETLGFEEQYGF